MAQISREAVKYYLGAEAVANHATDWDRVESMHGIEFPSSYKLFCDCTAAGCFGEHVYIFTPESKRVDWTLQCAIERERQSLSQANWERIKESLPRVKNQESLFPFGGTNNGEGLFWDRSGHSDSWPVLLIDYRSNIAEFVAEGSEEFFLKLISKKPMDPLFPNGSTEHEEYFRKY